MAPAYSHLGRALAQLGRFTEAATAYRMGLEIEPDMTGLYLGLFDLKKVEAGDPHLAALKAIGTRTDLTKSQRMALDFALGKAYADIGDHRGSFEHYLTANAAMRSKIKYDETESLALFDRIRRNFSAELIAAKAGIGDLSARPIFIVGMPRSGLHLLNRCLRMIPTCTAAVN